MVKFEWDKSKSENNVTKHGVSFEEASTIFLSDQIRVFTDNANSTLKEERLIAIGYSQHDRILAVIHCYRENDHPYYFCSKGY